MMRPSSPIEQPFDIETALANDDWRQRAAWPLPLSATRDMLAAIINRLDTLSRELPDPDGDTVALAGGWIFSAVAALANAAMQIEAGFERGIRLIGTDPALAWLSGENQDAKPFSKAGMSAGAQIPNHAFLRRVARTVALNKISRLPQALLAPRHIAVSHNHLLEDVAKRGSGGIGFQHSTTMFAAAASLNADAASNAVELAQFLTDEIISQVHVGDAIIARLRAIVAPVVERHIVTASKNLASLRLVKKLPQSMWSGTSGAYTARALALEIKRRGGQVTSFDHGGCTGMFVFAQALCLNELRPVTTFVAMTHKTAQLIETNPLVRALPENSRPRIVSHDGDPTFRPIAYNRRKEPSKRPKIVYPLGPFLGFRHIFPSLTPDPVYYDFLHRVISEISNLPIDLVLKPRPAGGLKHPMEALAKADYRMFEDVLPDADAVLFDDVHSTTFWETLCSDRSMILIDLKHNQFVPEIERLIQARVRIVTTRYDANNIPQWDATELQDALLSPAGQIDPSPFRSLLAASGVPSQACLL